MKTGYGQTVTLTVKDLNQKTLAVVSKRRFASGPQSLAWNAGDLPAGAYSLQLQVGPRRVSRPFTVLR